jgi:hypothetical protein
MDTKVRSNWKEAIEKREVPELTADTIKETFKTMYSDRESMFNEGVCNLFRQLSWDYKTNCPRMLGKKIIISRGVDIYKAPNGKVEITGMGYHTANLLDDLLRAMHILNGKPEPEASHRVWILTAEKHWPRQGWEHPFNLHNMLEIKACKNGNLHVKILRQDLIEG